MLVHSQDVVVVISDDEEPPHLNPEVLPNYSVPRGYESVAQTLDPQLWNSLIDGHQDGEELRLAQRKRQVERMRDEYLGLPGLTSEEDIVQAGTRLDGLILNSSKRPRHEEVLSSTSIESLPQQPDQIQAQKQPEDTVVYVDLSEEEEDPKVAKPVKLVPIIPAPELIKVAETAPESDSDDDIAVLSKEEAERSGTFKATSFERDPPQGGFNQPAPVVHAGSLSQAEMAEIQQDHKARQYFDNQTVPQLQEYDKNLVVQLQKFDQLRDAYLRQVSETRRRILTLSTDQFILRGELVRDINMKLREAETAMKRAKRVRRYKAVLDSVMEMKLYRPLHSLFANYGALQVDENPQSQMKYEGVPQGWTGLHLNPYEEDAVHLQQLLKDVYLEETIEGMDTTPKEMSVQLLNHQRQGLHWLLKREKAKTGCLLADDMGLGKTVQTIALMMANKSEDQKCKTTLIVGPVSLLRQWAAELAAKINLDDNLKVAFYHGAEKKKLGTYQKMAKFDVVLTSYTTLASEFKSHYGLAIEEAQVTRDQNVVPDVDSGGQNYVSPFFSPDATFYRLVLDEAQYIKNKLSQTSKATACLKGIHRLCLTGTPMQNSIDELYPIIRFLKVKPYDDEKKFKRDISVPVKSNSDQFDEYDRSLSMKKLRAVLLAIMLRRTKNSTVEGKPLVELPPKKVENVSLTMEMEESAYYKDLESGIQKKAKKLLNSIHKSLHSDILTLLLRLRQACIHLYLVEIGEMNSSEKNDNGTDILSWKVMYQHIQNFTEEVKRRIEWDLRRSECSTPMEEGVTDKEVQFTCPLCFDVVGEDAVVLFSPCGHMICDGCIETFFELRKVDIAEYGSRQAVCIGCEQRVNQNDLVDYSLFHRVAFEGFSYSKLEEIYGLISRGVKTTNSEKTSYLIKRHDGFMPSAKMTKTLLIIQDVFEKSSEEKIIVFSHFTTTFDLMGHVLKQEKIPFLRYDGSMNIDQKNSTIRDFYQGRARVLLISLKAGNVGLTLTCASHVIIMDPFWNPFVEEQAMDRAHRFGQQRQVNVYKLLIKDSVEDRIMDLQERKKELINSALDETALKKSSHLGRRELGYLFGLNSLELDE